MAEKVKIFKHSAATALKQLIDRGDLDAYASNAPDWSAILGEQFFRETSIEIVGGTIPIKMPEKKVKSGEDGGDDADDQKHDIANSLAVYNALKNLTPQQAADERVWLYLVHCELWKYVRARWPLPEDPEGRLKQIKLHYLVPSQRGLIRNNAVARLWWMGYVAHRCDFFEPEKTLRILLYKSDVRANLLERPSLAASEEIFNGVMKILGESFEKKIAGKKKTTPKKKTVNNEGIFHRGKFRELMKSLNRIGGQRMLNALGRDAVYKMAQKMAQKIK